MESAQSPSSSEIHNNEDPENIKVIEWEDFEQELARFWSLSSALDDAKQKKQILQKKLESLIQVEAESLNRSNELEQMRQKLDARKSIRENMSTDTKLVAEDAKTQEETLSTKVRSLLVAGAALSVARKRLQLQDSNKLISGEKGYIRLANLRRMLRTRQQYMISQVSLLYPVKISAGPTKEQELESFPSTSRSGNSTGSKPSHHGPLTILGLHLTMLPFKIMSFFTDKKEVQSFAAALGYVAHAVSLIASYLNVPLRYPLRLGGSHSYINDYAPSSTVPETLNTSLLSSTVKHIEFPLFLEGQDTTRAAYAVFLLNKDLEQLLNFIGVKSLGPRHLLANLKELLRIIQSADFVDS